MLVKLINISLVDGMEWMDAWIWPSSTQITTIIKKTATSMTMPSSTFKIKQKYNDCYCLKK